MMKKIFAIACISLFASSTFAFDWKTGYGDAGCGLGSMVFGDEQGFVQVLAATTNGTSGSQTFGITSGTSNCGGMGKTAAAFIEANKVSLTHDIARGHGETLVSLAEIYGVASVEKMGKTLKSSYKEIFAASEASDIEERIRTTLAHHKLI